MAGMICPPARGGKGVVLWGWLRFGYTATVENPNIQASPVTKRLWSLQYLRAIAAIMVVINHQFSGKSAFLALGHHGVDIFFVLSGFLMVATTDGKQVGPRKFIFDRIAKVVPPYWFATIITFLLFMVWTPYVEAAAPDLLVKSLAFIPAVGRGGNIWPTLYIGWTLNFEMFFYAMFAIALTVPRSWRIPALAVAIVGLAVSALLVTWSDTAMKFYTAPIMVEFLAGMLIAKIYGSRRGSRRSIVQHAIALCILTIGVVLLFGLWFAPIAIGLVVGALELERRDRVPGIPFLKMLGDASYSIYLFQQIAFDLTVRVMEWIGRATAIQLHVPGLAGMICAVSAIVLGVIMYYWFEAPVTRSIRDWLRRFERTDPPLAIA